MKKFYKLFVLLLVGLLLAGCSSNAYKYVENGDNSHIVLGSAYDPKVNINSEMLGMSAAPMVEFSSVAEMKNDIKNGNFTEAELMQIGRFKRDSEGNVQICSAENLYEPTIPLDGVELKRLIWSGTGYSFFLENDDFSVEIMPISRERAEKDIDEDYVNARYITNYKKKEHVPEVNGTAYYFNFTGVPGKDILYTFVQDDTTYYVQERCQWNGVSDPTYSIVIYGLSNSQSFYLFISPKDADTFPYNLSIEQLSQFGLRKYVETEVS